MAKNLKVIVILIAIFYYPFNCLLYAQISSFNSVEELKKEAENLFTLSNYIAAAPLYSQLLSLYPKDHTYNYNYGVCLLYTDKDKLKAINHLEYSIKTPKPISYAFFYLAKAYHLSYYFDEAIKTYEKFKSIAPQRDIESLGVDREIKMCRNGITLLKAFKKLEIVNKKEINKNVFYSAYDASQFGGKILATPENFKSQIDKKKKENSTIYLSKENQVIYYSSYGNDNTNNKDLYKILKLPNGEWALPQNLGFVVNTSYDEDYPFITPDGKILYFSSKGHNSVGGYDIFRSTWSDSSQSWSIPENLGFPVNSPDDDIFFITNYDADYAYYSSGRESSPGKIEVYKIKLPQQPIELSVIKGYYLNKVQSQSEEARISVMRASDKKLIGVYTVNKKGEYIISLPSDELYTFVIEAEGYLPHAENIFIPLQTQFQLLKQEFKLKKDKLGEEITIVNHFSEEEQDKSIISEEPKQITNALRYEGDYKNNLTPIDINGETVYAVFPNKQDLRLQKQDSQLISDPMELLTGMNSIISEPSDSSTHFSNDSLALKSESIIDTDEDKEVLYSDSSSHQKEELSLNQYSPEESDTSYAEEFLSSQADSSEEDESSYKKSDEEEKISSEVETSNSLVESYVYSSNQINTANSYTLKTDSVLENDEEITASGLDVEQDELSSPENSHTNEGNEAQLYKDTNEIELDSTQEEYVFYKSVEEIKELKNEMEELYWKAYNTDLLAQREFEEVQNKKSRAEEISDSLLKFTLLAEAQDLEKKAWEKQAQSQDFFNDAKELLAKCEQRDEEVKKIKTKLDSLGLNLSNNYQYKQDFVKKETSKKYNATAGGKSGSTNLIAFKFDSTFYSASSPIPINIELPGGLIFKVQVGAFRNPIPQDLFKGIYPVVGEKAKPGFVRYTAGLFKALESAVLAREEIRSLGYRDAFVVAYYNGLRISLSEVRNMLNQYSSKQRREYKKKEEEEITMLNSYNIFSEKYHSKDKGIMEINLEILSKDGLLYTVQVGVYSSSILPSILEEIDSVYREKTTLGLYRYTSGTYKSLSSANYAKNLIIKNSIQDAFVIAFYKGNRISIKKALALENQSYAKNTNTSIDETYNYNIESHDASIIITFKVQVGAFKYKVPFEIADIYMRVRDKGITHKSNEGGLDIFYIGYEIKDYEMALALKDELVKEGLRDAFVVAFKNTEQIPLEEALAYSKK